MDRIQAMRAFVRLVELGSFTEVAEEIGVTQSTASKWLQGLEEELGARLVERTTRSLHVTRSGSSFYERAREIVAAYDAALEEVHEETATLRGRLRVNVPVVFGSRFIVPLVPLFLKVHPLIEFDLHLSDRYVSLVDEGFDLAVRVGVPVDSSLRALKMGESPRFLVASPEYLSQAPPLRAPQDLKDHSCLVHSTIQASTIWVFQRKNRRVRTVVRGRCTANHSEALLALAREGSGVALLARWLVEEDLRAGRLVRLLPRFLAPPAPVMVLTPSGSRVGPKVRAFVDFLKDSWGEKPSFLPVPPGAVGPGRRIS